MDRQRGKFFRVGFSDRGFPRLIGKVLLEDDMAVEREDDDAVGGWDCRFCDSDGDDDCRRCDQVDAAEEPALDTMLSLGILVLGFYSDELPSPWIFVFILGWCYASLGGLQIESIRDQFSYNVIERIEYNLYYLTERSVIDLTMTR
jgi:hypothetical protein